MSVKDWLEKRETIFLKEPLVKKLASANPSELTERLDKVRSLLSQATLALMAVRDAPEWIYATHSEIKAYYDLLERIDSLRRDLTEKIEVPIMIKAMKKKRV